jgi:hypothetical protein
MAGLRSLLELPDTGGAVPLNGALTTLRVYNTAPTTVNNTGRLCAWTVPANVTWVAVELWGGGGGGGGGSQCIGGKPGGAGTYARKIFNVTPADVWQVCAAGTTCCTCGVAGFPSYFCKTGDTGFCASGGAPGCAVQGGQCGPGSCIPLRTCAEGTVCNATMAICGIQGFAKWNIGVREGFMQYAPGAPYAHGGTWGPMGFFGECGTSISGGNTPWPGSGGFAAQHCCCVTVLCGDKGHQGMVQLTFMASE